MSDFNESIIDATKPNAGRVYDYLLGGNHNFDVDKQMGDKLLEMAPFASDYSKLTRWFLGIGILRAVKRGYTQFLDFASGLPTDDHIHKNTPEGTKVIYSDIDPVTVDYSKEIIGENPIVKYVTCDAAKPEILLESDIVKSIFGDNHKAAIGFNGICWFLKDEQISHAMKVLYDWADEGSMLFLIDIDGENLTEETKSIFNLYKNMRQPMYIRSITKLNELIKPWKIEKPGFLHPEKWVDLTPTISEKSIKAFGGSTMGCFLKK